MAFSATPVLGELKAQVQTWLDRDDPATVAAIPDFIRYAHDETVRALRIPLTRSVVQGYMTDERNALPDDLQALVSLNINDTRGLPLRVTAESVRAGHAAIWPAGRPVEYVLEAGAVALAPVPDQPYPFTLVYDASPLLMQDDGDTNAIFTKTPFLYLQGALAAGFLFNQDAQQAALYEGQFRATLARVQKQGVVDAYAGGPLVMRASTRFCP